MTSIDGPLPRIVYLDQNAWVALARGAWNKVSYPAEHRALTIIVGAVEAGQIRVPISFSNLYETAKINDPSRRINLARTQALISGGWVFRGRRQVLTETLRTYLAHRFGVQHKSSARLWFLSNLWLEAAADYSPETFGQTISNRMLVLIRARPAETLFSYLAFGDETSRMEEVRRFTAQSAELVAGIERRRAIVANETPALRRRAYGARLVLDELNFILATGRDLGLPWGDVRDLGSSLVRSILVDIPILNVERELAVRLEGQTRAITENDIRDMAAFAVTLPIADVIVAEKQFVSLSRQAALDARYATKLLTSIFDLSAEAL